MVDKGKGFQIFAHILLSFLIICAIAPFILLIMSSITEEQTLITNGYSFFPEKFSTYAYEYLFTKSAAVFRGYAISFLVTAIGTVCNLLFTTLYAYPLSRKELPGRNIFAFYLFFTMLFSGGLVPSYLMWTQTFHIRNTVFALLIPNLLMSAFNVIMMRTSISPLIFRMRSSRRPGLTAPANLRYFSASYCPWPCPSSPPSACLLAWPTGTTG